MDESTGSQGPSERGVAEAAECSSEELFAKVFRSSPEPICISRLDDGVILDVNGGFETICGLRRDEVVGKSVLDLGIWTEGAECRETMVRELRANGAIRDFETTWRTKSGELHVCLLSGETFRHDDESCLILVVRDITAQKRVETDLDRSRRFTDNLVNTANVIIVGLDIEGNITLFNPAAERITGYSRSELAGRNWFETLVPRDRYEYVYDIFARLMDGRLPRTFENPILTKGGEERTIAWSNNELMQDDAIVGTISFGIDITERKKAEEALRLTQTAVDRTTDAVFWVRRDGSLGYVNDEACRSTEYTREELISMSVFDIDAEYPREAFPQLWDELKRAKNSLIERPLTSKSGRVIPVEVRISYVEFSGREYMFAFARDITERKRAEDQLLKLNEQLLAERAALDDKNVALREVLGHLEQEMKQYKHEICDSVEKLVFPAVTRLSEGDGRLGKREVAALKDALGAILQKDIDRFAGNMAKLSPRELDICELIKSGRSSKEVSEELNISTQTVHTHRNAIRRKLQIKNKAVNLAAYLRSR
jgi:PAS domain S-box-containing protein